jgi:regulator of replication initiation timing
MKDLNEELETLKLENEKLRELLDDIHSYGLSNPCSAPNCVLDVVEYFRGLYE